MFRLRKFGLLIVILFLLLVILVTIVAFSAANFVPVTHVDEIVMTVAPFVSIPPECAGMTFDYVIDISLGQTPTDLNDYIIGTNNRDTIDGLAGDDCIDGVQDRGTLLGGPGNDVLISGTKQTNLYGNDGDDKLYGGPKKDVFDGGNGTDICYSGGGGEKPSDYTSCETILP